MLVVVLTYDCLSLDLFTCTFFLANFMEINIYCNIARIESKYNCQIEKNIHRAKNPSWQKNRFLSVQKNCSNFPCHP